MKPELETKLDQLKVKSAEDREILTSAFTMLDEAGLYLDGVADVLHDRLCVRGTRFIEEFIGQALDANLLNKDNVVSTLQNADFFLYSAVIKHLSDAGIAESFNLNKLIEPEIHKKADRLCGCTLWLSESGKLDQTVFDQLCDASNEQLKKLHLALVRAEVDGELHTPGVVTNLIDQHIPRGPSLNPQ